MPIDYLAAVDCNWAESWTELLPTKPGKNVVEEKPDRTPEQQNRCQDEAEGDCRFTRIGVKEKQVHQGRDI